MRRHASKIREAQLPGNYSGKCRMTCILNSRKKTAVVFGDSSTISSVIEAECDTCQQPTQVSQISVRTN